MLKKRYNYFDDDTAAPVKSSRAAKREKVSPENKRRFVHEVKVFAKKTEKVAKTIAKQSEEKIALEKEKEPKKLALKICLLFVALVIAAALIAFVITINSENKRDQEFNSNAGKICTQYVSEYGSCSYENLDTYGVSGYRMTGVCLVRQIDFDNDGKSELLIGYNSNGTYYAEVWGYRKKEFTMLYKDTMYQTKDERDDVWLTLYYHHGKYYIGEHDKEDVSKVALYTLRGEKFKKTDECTYDSTADAFYVGKKQNTDDFERVRVSVLREASAYDTADTVNAQMDSFSDDSGTTTSSDDNQSGTINGAYYEIVSDLNSKYGVAKSVTSDSAAYIDGLALVELIDFDSDGTDELVTVYRRTVSEREEDEDGNYVAGSTAKYFCDIYKYNGTIATRVYSNEGLSNKLNSEDDVYFVLKQTGSRYYLCTNSFTVEDYGHKITATSKILAFNGETFEQKQKAYYETSYGYTEYYFDDEWASKSSFTLNGGFSVPFFDGSDDYSATEYEVTYLSTKSSEKERLDGVVESTVAAIKELNSGYDPDNVITDS